MNWRSWPATRQWFVYAGLILCATPAMLLGWPDAIFGCVLLALALLLKAVSRAGPHRQSPFAWPLRVLLLTALMGVVVAMDRALALNRLSSLLLGMAVFWLFAGMPDPSRWSPRLGLCLAGGGALIALASLVLTDWSLGVIVQIPGLYDRIPLLYHLRGSGVPYQNSAQAGVHPRVVAAALTVALPLPLALAAMGGRKWLRFLAALAALPIALTLLLSQSPQGFLGMALAIALMIVWRWPRVLPGVLAVALAIGLTWWGYQWWLPTPLVERIRFGANGRLNIWPGALLMIRDLPWTGTGLNNFPVVFARYAIDQGSTPHAHNVFMQTTLDHGLFGLLALVALFSVALVQGWRAYRRAQTSELRATLLGCAGACVAYLGYGLWDSMTLGQKAAPLIWAGLGILAANVPAKSSDLATQSRSHWRRWLWVGAAALVLLASPIWLSSLAVNAGRMLWLYLPAERPATEATSLWQKGQNLADLALRLTPGNSRAYVLRGTAEAAMGDDRRGAEDLERGLASDPGDKAAHMELAEAYARLGQDDLAITHWRLAGDRQILATRAETARKARQTDEALRWYNLAIKTWPEDAETVSAASSLLRETGQAEEALALWKRYMASYPQRPEGYQGAASLLLTLQRPAEAREITAQGLRSAAVDGDLYAVAAEADAAVGDLSGALAMARQAVAMSPKSPSTWYRLGVVLQKSGQNDEALQAHLRCAALDHEFWGWMARQAAGTLYQAQGRVEDAIEMYRVAGSIMQTIREDDEAVVWNDVLLGDALRTAGRNYEATQAYQAALDLSPGYEPALQGLEKLDSR